MFPPRVRPGAWSGGGAPVPIIGLGPQTQFDPRPEDPVDCSVRLPVRPRKIWELADTLHCSIVGTCLSTADLRHVLVRLDLPGAAAAEHELPVLEVTLASRREAGAKLLQKALDRRHDVGGRANQVHALKLLVERAGARVLHDDGGIEHNSAHLPGLISRADRVLFPTDCISHDAMTIIKRICGRLEKQFEPLRTASLPNLLVALPELGRTATRTSPQTEHQLIGMNSDELFHHYTMSISRKEAPADRHVRDHG